MPKPEFVEGMAALAGRYGGFVFDQWGVLHDGAAPYPGVLDALHRLKAQGRRLVMLTNSGRRAELNGQRLEKLGFDLGDFEGIVTSGEAAWQLMRERAEPPYDRLGRRCLLFTNGGDLEVVKGLDLEVVEDADEADFIFVSGIEPGQDPEKLRPLLKAAAARRLPLICSNPDIVAVSAGELIPAPGSLARIYTELGGGEVSYVGKPHRPIYAACLRTLDGLRPEEIVAVGDSMDHDVRGALNVGLHAAFVTGGIHRDLFPERLSGAARTQALDRLIEETGVSPHWVIPGLVW